MQKSQTILSTDTFNIGGQNKKVEKIKNSTGRQDISYRVEGKDLSYEAFWALNPVKVDPKVVPIPSFAGILAHKIFGSVVTL